MAFNDFNDTFASKADHEALDANLQRELKVQEHIEKGQLAPHEVAIYIFANGSVGQNISMFQNLQRSLKESREREMTAFLQELNEHMCEKVTELQVAVPGALAAILPLLTEQQVLLMFSVVQALLDSNVEAVRGAWSPFALDILGYISPAELVRVAVPLALKKGEHSEKHDQRVFSCALIGRLCKYLDAQTIVSTILNRARHLCMDTETTVRAAICEQLGEVARAIGLQLTKERITQSLFELLSDEEKLVSRAAFTTLIDLVEFFDPPYRREHFYPFIKDYIASPPEEVLSILIEEYGRFLWKIKSDIQCQEDITLFANFFRQSAQRTDPEVRRLCAYNLPAVVASLPASVYPTHLTQTARALATDSHPPVRRAIAAGMAALIPILQEKAAFYLKDSFLALLQDSELDVQTVAIDNLSQLLECFSTQLRGEEREMFFRGVVPHLLSYEETISKNWRKVAKLLDAFDKFPNYFSGVVLHGKFLPILMKHLVKGAAAIKEQCASLVVLFTGNLGDNNLSVEVFSRIVSEFCKSPCCFNRSTFALLFRYCCRSYSRKFVRARLLEPFLELSKDPVVNVRLQLVKSLPAIRRCLKQPVESEHINSYNLAIERLKQDPAAEVLCLLSQVTEQIEEIEKDFARQLALRQLSADDQEDRQLEEHEGDLLDVAKEQEKLERRQKLREMLGENNPPPKQGGRTQPGGKAPAPKTMMTTPGTKRINPAPGSKIGTRPSGKR